MASPSADYCSEPHTLSIPTTPRSGGEPPSADLSGRTIGDFQVLRRLGQGGMGQVYLAEQVSLKRKVALKVLRPELARNEASLARFRTEAEAVARMTHANIVQVYFIGAVDGLPFMALEYVEGKNLREYLTKKGALELPLALSIMRQVATALVRAGESGIIHRDIKPDNILLTRKGEVKVTDFGLSRIQSENEGRLNLTQTGVTMGTPLYMAPEQAEGKPLDCRTDIYSFGVTCYHMFAGEPPYRGNTAFEVALQHVKGQPPPLAGVRPDLPPAVCALVHRMMARLPDDRYPTARDVLRDINKLRGGTSNAALVVPSLAPSVELLSAVDANEEEISVELLPAVTAFGGETQGRTTQRQPRPRWLMPLLFGLSLVTALLIGALVARIRRPASPPPSSPSSGSEVADVESQPSQNDEPALRRTAEMYIATGAGKDVSVGMSLCLQLSILYLEQHRLDDAEKLFNHLDAVKDVRAYHTLGRLGRAIVLALRDRSQESNHLFREIAFWIWVREVVNPKDNPKPPDPELVKLWHNPSFLFWLAQAVRYNRTNGVPDDQVPAPLLKLLEPLKSRS